MTIENFDLEANISAVVRSLPSSLTGIWLKNNLLTELPVEIASFLSLDTLCVRAASPVVVDELSTHSRRHFRVVTVDNTGSSRTTTSLR